MKDYYKILGITRRASENAIKQQFKELAFENHSDVSENKNADEIFIEIYEAYHILSIPDKKATYDIFYDKYIAGTDKQVQNEESIKTDIQDISYSARKTATQKVKVKYTDFIKESDCFFKVGCKADGKPYYYHMHKTIGISGGPGPMGSIKSKTVRIPVPRSKKGIMMHRFGFLIKLIFLIIMIFALKLDIVKEAKLTDKILVSSGILLLGGFLTHLTYILNKTKSKCFQANRYFLVKKYKKKGYKRGFHPMISTTPVGFFALVFRWLF